MSCYISSKKKNRKKIRYKRHGWKYIVKFIDIMNEDTINYLKKQTIRVYGVDLFPKTIIIKKEIEL